MNYAIFNWKVECDILGSIIITNESSTCLLYTSFANIWYDCQILLIKIICEKLQGCTFNFLFYYFINNYVRLLTGYIWFTCVSHLLTTSLVGMIYLTINQFEFRFKYFNYFKLSLPTGVLVVLKVIIFLLYLSK